MTSMPNGPVPPPPSSAIRVPLTTQRPTIPGGFAGIGRFIGDNPGEVVRDTIATELGVPYDMRIPDGNAMSYSPLELQDTGAALMFDVAGVRLDGSREVALAVGWHEAARVGLSMQHSQMLGLQVLRFVLWPADPGAFLANHPGSGPAWDAALQGVGIAICKAPQIPQGAVELSMAGLRFAGPRFSGTVDQLPPT